MAPSEPQSRYQLKKSVISWFKRHLNDTKGNKTDALEITRHSLLHMGHSDDEWRYIEEVLSELSNRHTQGASE